MELACRAYVKNQEFFNELLTWEISDVEKMCHANFNGNWELFFLPKAGGFYDQPAKKIDRIFKIIRYINNAIDENRPNNNK